jgi:hypothetical protein
MKTDDEKSLLASGRETVESLAAALLPCKVYLLFSSEGAPLSLSLPNALGVAGASLDLSAWPWLAGRDGWHGRRPAVFIDDSAIMAMMLDDWGITPDRIAPEFADLLNSVALHELAHVATIPADVEPETAARREYAETLHAYVAATFDFPQSTPPWFGHDFTFVRSALHLRFRALQIGAFCSAGNMIDSQFYGLSPVYFYWQALMGEMKCRQSLPIFELAHVRPSNSVLALWRSDVKRWRDSQEHLTERVAAICGDAISIFGD